MHVVPKQRLGEHFSTGTSSSVAKWVLHASSSAKNLSVLLIVTLMKILCFQSIVHETAIFSSKSSFYSVFY